VKAIVGLGNPGEEYRKTRHNIGFMVIDEMARQASVRFKKKYGCLLGATHCDDETVLLAKPQTFMNGSGKATLRLRDSYSLHPSDLIVVHDDLDLAFGRLRIRSGGGAGGHLGVASVLSALAEGGFFRIRVGIGRPGFGEDPTDFVLSCFNAEEQELLQAIVQRSTDAAWCLVRDGPTIAMNRFSRKKTTE
jgi:PTH1 family peptidyl-tRNA hydrolase